MRTYVRPFAVLVALGWIAAWGVALILMWRSGSEARINATDFEALASIDTAGTARWIGTGIGLGAIVFALPVLLAALRPSPARLVTPASTHDGAHPVMREQPVPDRTPETEAAAEMPASLRRTTAQPEPVATTRVEPPLLRTETATHESIEARLARHEEELRHLRELLTRQGSRPNQEATPEHENAYAGRRA